MAAISVQNSPQVPQKTVWSRESILKLIMESDEALFRGLVALYERQTHDEQVTSETRHNNGRGFTGADAKLLSSFAQRVIRYQANGYTPVLTPNQIAWARKKMPKYANQLLKVAKEKEATTQSATAH